MYVLLVKNFSAKKRHWKLFPSLYLKTYRPLALPFDLPILDRTKNQWTNSQKDSGWKEREKINNEIFFTAIFRHFFVCMINYHLKFILHKHTYKNKKRIWGIFCKIEISQKIACQSRTHSDYIISAVSTVELFLTCTSSYTSSIWL